MDYLFFNKGSADKVSEDFSSREFDCHGSGCCGTTKINKKLVDYLQTIRNHFNAPVKITSAYRCPTHNKKVGGASASKHMLGDAADIIVTGHSPSEVARYAESIGILGIGLYETSKDGYFVHIDTRERKAFWYGQAQAPRTTFGGKVTPTVSTQNTATSSTLSYGSKGEAVKQLQMNLIALGFSCGAAGADGRYGLGTTQAVKNFQASQGFAKVEQDGIYGQSTKAALEKAIKGTDSSIKNVYRVTASALNVRSAPAITKPIVGVLKRGETCQVLEIKEGWGKILGGWVSMDYLIKN